MRRGNYNRNDMRLSNNIHKLSLIDLNKLNKKIIVIKWRQVSNKENLIRTYKPYKIKKYKLLKKMINSNNRNNSFTLLNL